MQATVISLPPGQTTIILPPNQSYDKLIVNMVENKLTIATTVFDRVIERQFAIVAVEEAPMPAKKREAPQPVEKPEPKKPKKTAAAPPPPPPVSPAPSIQKRDDTPSAQSNGRERLVLNVVTEPSSTAVAFFITGNGNPPRLSKQYLKVSGAEFGTDQPLYVLNSLERMKNVMDSLAKEYHVETRHVSSTPQIVGLGYKSLVIRAFSKAVSQKIEDASTGDPQFHAAVSADGWFCTRNKDLHVAVNLQGIGGPEALLKPGLYITNEESQTRLKNNATGYGFFNIPDAPDLRQKSMAIRVQGGNASNANMLTGFPLITADPVAVSKFKLVWNINEKHPHKPRLTKTAETPAGVFVLTRADDKCTVTHEENVPTSAEMAKRGQNVIALTADQYVRLNDLIIHSPNELDVKFVTMRSGRAVFAGCQPNNGQTLWFFLCQPLAMHPRGLTEPSTSNEAPPAAKSKQPEPTVVAASDSSDDEASSDDGSSSSDEEESEEEDFDPLADLDKNAKPKEKKRTDSSSDEEDGDEDSSSDDEEEEEDDE